MAQYEKIKGMPEGFHSVTPYLSVTGGVKAIEFYEKAFGAKEIKESREQAPDGKLIHARMKIGDSLVMISDRFRPEDNVASKSPVTLHIYSDDVDQLWKNAIAAGAKIDMPIGDMFWGERYGQIVDPFGHRWSMSTRLNMSKEDMEAQRKEAMKMFSTDKPPENKD